VFDTAKAKVKAFLGVTGLLSLVGLPVAGTWLKKWTQSTEEAKKIADVDHRPTGPSFQEEIEEAHKKIRKIQVKNIDLQDLWNKSLERARDLVRERMRLNAAEGKQVNLKLTRGFGSGAGGGLGRLTQPLQGTNRVMAEAQRQFDINLRDAREKQRQDIAEQQRAILEDQREYLREIAENTKGPQMAVAY